MTTSAQLINITKFMNILELDIAREQAYISKHGEANDLDPDSQWEQYKEKADYNLKTWDEMKAMRDALKSELAGA